MVSRRSISIRKQYAEDPEYRNKKLAAGRAYHAAHRDEINARQRERYRTDPDYAERIRDRGYIRRYGISRADYEVLLARQGGVCAICRRKSRRRLVVDHCHVCRRVRDLLCHNCNLGLGLFCDDTSRLYAAIAYLERSRRAAALSTGPTGCVCAADAPGMLRAEQPLSLSANVIAAGPQVREQPPLPVIADAPSRRWPAPAIRPVRRNSRR